jgi:regulator of protease activity HflC (stomatin/prohibitin superfamily)
MVPLLFALVVVGMIMLTGVRILREYERAVVFRLGRARKQLAGPGLVLMLPLGVDRARVVDLRTKVVQIPPQEVITRDNISIVVDAVVYITVESPAHAILDVEQYMPATLQLAATTLRTVIGRMDLDEILAHRDSINEEVRSLLDARTEQWGIDISAVELRDIVLPQEMKRAMARQAEAERERRAKVIAAEGEVQAAAKLSQAAQLIAENPSAMQLRMYQALTEMAAEPASKIVVPVPVELLSGLSGNAAGKGPTIEQLTQAVRAALQSSEDGTRAPTLTAGAPRPGVQEAPVAKGLAGPKAAVGKEPRGLPSGE